MPTARALLVVVAAAGLVAAGAAVGPAGAAQPDDGRLTVTDVTVSPAAPTTADRVTFEVALGVSAGGPSPVAVETVELRTADGETLASAGDLGTLSQGDALTVPLATAFDEAGPRDLVVVASGTDDAGNRTTVRRPVSVVVEPAPPQVETEVRGAVAGTATTVTVVVANPTDGELRGVEVTALGAGTEAARATVPALASGAQAATNLTIRPDEPGERTLRLRVGYTASSGTRASTTLNRTVEVAPAERDLGVRVGPAPPEEEDSQVPAGVQGVLGGRTTEQDDDGPDDRPGRVEVTVTNFGNVPAEDVVLRPVAGNESLARQAVADRLAPGESATATADLSGLEEDATVEFRVRARSAGAAVEGSATYDARPAAGEVTVTGLNLSLADESTLVLRGNLGNVGERPVTGAVVRVGESEFAGPAYPSRSYFVGTVDGSEFAPFEVTAEVDAANVTAVPLEVRYTVAGEERVETVAVPFDDSLREGEDGDGPSGVAGLLSGAVVLAVLPAGWFALRRFGDDR